MSTRRPIPVIDLFAGPGGLGEGFSSLVDEADNRVFKIGLSIEKDPIAHRTLRLRSFYRQFEYGEAPADYYSYLRGDAAILSQEALFERHAKQGRAAEEEAWCATLGETPAREVDERIREALKGHPKSHPWILIGGPPCQAYSLVGRSRMIGAIGASAFYEDKRHTLYKQYLKLIQEHKPALFVMENVKGLLSSKLDDAPIFERILADLRTPQRGLNYRLIALSPQTDKLFSGEDTQTSPEDFLLRAEQHGIPQARHRLIIVGIRSDMCRGDRMPAPLESSAARTCWQAISDLPALRSRLSRGNDSDTAWLENVRSCISEKLNSQLRRLDQEDVANEMATAASRTRIPSHDGQSRFIEYNAAPEIYRKWFVDKRLGGFCNHQARSHIARDIWRYLFAAAFGRVRERSPAMREFPAMLLPAHANVDEAVSNRMFGDRFRVQVEGKPSTTVTSHISKDGHYFIHPDPLQSRSLTVREAARLQTFPDNYFFEGPRTEQYHQVGNAVPPLLARQVAASVARFLDGSLKLKPLVS
jgi:DNA (cytosine-5)-methyltransferase 1